MNRTRTKSLCLAPLLGCALTLSLLAAIPPAEKLLPPDTLLLVTAPDFTRTLEIYKRLPQSQLWNDPAMRPFREKLVNKWNEELVKPLERELGIKVGDYTSLPQGQLTFAVTANGWNGGDEPAPGMLVLLDAKAKSGQLKKNLAAIRKQWTDAGKPSRTEKIRDIEFTVLSISSNDMPSTLKKFFPPTPEVQELGTEQPAKTQTKSELVFGQVESLLVAGNSLKSVEQVVIRLTGSSAPTLGDQAAYQANHLALFRDSPAYAWLNAKALIDALAREASEKKENPDAPNPFDFKPDKLIAALGLSSLKSAAFAFHESSDGTLMDIFLTVPESSRQGIFKILAGEAKETSPPPFVPAEAVKFQRWRLDGKKAWASVEKILTDISPQAIATVNFLLDSANTYAREKDPGFDIRKNLIDNLGDDLISYEKAPRGASKGELDNPPALLLVGSANAEQLANALKSILIFVNQQAGTPPEEREFLGRKIYSVALRSMALPGAASASAPKQRTLSYAASGNYVAFSTDSATLEEYLRSADSRGKALRETAGLPEASQKVAGQGASLFGYENQAETLRASFDAIRTAALNTNSPASSVLALLPMGTSLAGAQENLKSWLDFSLLPPFEKVAKYFHYYVYGGTATAEGLSLKIFEPNPPGLKVAAAEKE